MTLAEYLDAHDMSCAEFARRLGVPDSTVLRWSKGERTPTVDWLFELERATDGAVPVSVWSSGTVHRSRRRASKGSRKSKQ